MCIYFAQSTSINKTRNVKRQIHKIRHNAAADRGHTICSYFTTELLEVLLFDLFLQIDFYYNTFNI